MDIYLDNSATTRVSPQVAELMMAMATENYGNPSSLHRKGFAAEQAVTTARGQISSILGVRQDEVFFLSCGSEANNLALLGGARALRRSGNGVVTTAVEHASLLGGAAQLEKEGFAVARVLPESDGSLTPEAVASQVDGNTIMVSVMHVNSETGSINDIAAIAAAVRRKNPKALIHSDCVQSFCRLPVTPRRWEVDLVTVSGHKIHGPKGAAALYRRKGVRLLPLYYGSSQEGGLHSGTENTAAICGMGLAASQCWTEWKENQQLYLTLRQRLLEKIKKIPGVCINSPHNGALHIMNLSLPGVRSEVMIHYLEQFGIYVSSGSACSRGVKSHVLTAMGLPDDRIDSAIRVSFCSYNTCDDVDAFAKHLSEGCRTLAKRK